MNRLSRLTGYSETKYIVYIICLTLILLAGCMSVQKPKMFPFSGGEISVVGNVIYCNAKPFAELRCFEAIDKDATAPVLECTEGLGLVMYYYAADREVWIHPKEGISVYRDGVEYIKIEDMNRVWREFLHERKIRANTVYESTANRVSWAHLNIGGKAAGKEKLIRSYVYEAKISEDGKYVSYKTQGMLFDSSRKYSVEYGLSN